MNWKKENQIPVKQSLYNWIVYSNRQDIERLSLEHDGKLINACYGDMDGSIFIYEK
ncbi:hypothetical protein [Indibacter alkaliphilus]|nr:hypothetical protein [Indibacter alkaliphilus]